MGRVTDADIGLQPLLVDPLVGRSGSTLLMSILATGSEIAFDRAYPYENRYLTYLCRLVAQIDSSAPAPPEWSMMHLLRGPAYEIGPLPFSPAAVETRELSVRLIRHFWAALAESITAHASEPPKYYAEKTWADNLETLGGAGIESRVINLVRDPRDVAASVRAFDQKRGQYGFGRCEGQTDAEFLAVLVDTMKRSLERMHRRSACRDHAWVRYEDLVRDPDQVVNRLSAWLGVELEADGAKSRGRVYRRHATTKSPAASVGRWRQDLSAADLAIIETALGSEMRRLGYGDDVA